MTLYIVRFIPYAGGASIDGVFRNEANARKVHKSAKDTQGISELCFEDGFGVEIVVNPNQCAIIFLSTDASVAVQKALEDASRPTAPIVINPGSTMQ